MIKRGLPTSEYRPTVLKTITFYFFYDGENFSVIMNHVISNILSSIEYQPKYFR